MQHLGTVTGFAHRSLGSTFQQSLNQREIVLKLIARKSIQITNNILQWFVMIHFELISTVNKRIDRGNSSRFVCLFVWFYGNTGSFFIVHSCDASWKIARERKRKTNSAVTTSFLWSTLQKNRSVIVKWKITHLQDCNHHRSSSIFVDSIRICSSRYKEARQLAWHLSQVHLKHRRRMIRQEPILWVRREKVKVRGGDEQERKKNDNPEGSTPSYNNSLYGEAPPWKGFLTQASGIHCKLSWVLWRCGGKRKESL